VLEVTDDSGFLAVLVPMSYEGFVDSDWRFAQLLGHFRTQMERQSLLIWSTGHEGFWQVDVRLGRSQVRGFREVVGPLRVVGGAVLITNYESLTMAAQFADVRLPEPHHWDSLLKVPDGDYACRVVQMFDPAEAESTGADKPDFTLELIRTSDLPSVWSEIPWFSAVADGGDRW
jgi:hypothetical protein